MPESITLIVSVMFFWPYVAIIVTAFLKKTAAIEATTVVSDCMMVIYNIVSCKKKNRC